MRFSSKVLCRSRSGFIAMYAFVLLLILAILGLSYWAVSRTATDMLIREAWKIKARNYAQAGIEKVKVNIMNQYLVMGVSDVTYYPGKFSHDRYDKEYNREFGDGAYSVESIKPYKIPESDKDMKRLPYYKNGVLIGFYDVWEVVAVGTVKSLGVSARMTTLVKVIHKITDY